MLEKGYTSMKINTESTVRNLLAVILAVLVLIASPGLMVTTALSAGLLVTTADDENDGCAVGNCSLREAIAAASPGDTITFAGDYDIVLTSTLTIDKALIIDGSDHAITINGNDAVRVFHVSADTHATFNHLTITHGQTNTPEWPEISPFYPVGGAIKIESGAVVTLIDCVVDRNVATYYDAGWNEYYGLGGAIFNLGTLSVSGTIFSDNVAASRTGYVIGAGGAIHNQGTLFVSGSTFTGNAAESGGAICSSFDTTMTVENSTFTGNSAPCGGGAISGSGTSTVSGCTISGNQSPGGWCEGGAAGIENRGGIMTVSNSTISGNSGVSNPGGLSNYYGELTVTDSAIYNNTTGWDGGGIYNWWDSVLTVISSSIYSNTAVRDGGGILNGGNINTKLTLINSTLSQNTAKNGGGLCNGSPSGFSGEALSMTNSTVVSNIATGSGGGFYNRDSAAVTLDNTILWGNTAPTGPQIYNNSTNRPTISDSDIEGSGGSGTGWNTMLGADGGDNLDADPLLGPLADNGGPTPTQALLVGSPAIDKADAVTCPGIDQRGVPRPLGDGCDIGAFEYGGDIVLFHAVTYDANGATSGIAPANQTKIYNVALTLATNSGGLARNGYTFSGWNTATDGSGTDYAEGAPYTANAAVTLYAEWAAAGPTAIPTLSEWGMILFSLLMAAAAVIVMRKRNKMAA